jgi:aquaporin Z
MSVTRRATAEFVGTFWLVLGGCERGPGRRFPERGNRAIGLVLAFRLTVLAMAYALGQVSGLPTLVTAT